MNKHSINLAENDNALHVQLYEPLLNFLDWETDQILIYSDKYFCADLYICEDTDYDCIFVGITYNPIFEIHLEYIVEKTVKLTT